MKYVRNLILFTVGIVGLAIVGGVVTLTYLQARVITAPPFRSLPGNTPADVGITDYETLTLVTEDGIDIRAWYAPPPTDNPGPAVVFVHGIGGNLAALLPEAGLLYSEGYGVLLLDMRGHGESGDGGPTFGFHEVRDVREALDFLLQQPTVDSEGIGIVGWSMGGTTALLSAQQNPEFKAVWVNSAYSSFLELVGDRATSDFKLPARPVADLVVFFANRRTGVNFYEANPGDNMAALGDRPVRIYHGEADWVVPVASAGRLQAAAVGPIDVTVLPGVSHESLFIRGGETYRSDMVAFFDAALK